MHQLRYGWRTAQQRGSSLSIATFHSRICICSVMSTNEVAAATAYNLMLQIPFSLRFCTPCSKVVPHLALLQVAGNATHWELKSSLGAPGHGLFGTLPLSAARHGCLRCLCLFSGRACARPPCAANPSDCRRQSVAAPVHIFMAYIRANQRALPGRQMSLSALMLVRLCHWPAVLSLNIRVVCSSCNNYLLLPVAFTYVYPIS